MARIPRFVFPLLGVMLAVAACRPETEPPPPTASPTATATRPPTATPWRRPQGTPVPAFTPTPLPWNQGGPWPTPQNPLEATFQGPAAPDALPWAEVLPVLVPAREFWPGFAAQAWPGPALPPQAQALFTARGPDFAEVFFTLEPRHLPALQQAVAQAGWQTFPNTNPELAQMAPGLVLLEFHTPAGNRGPQLNIFLGRLQGQTALWGRMRWSAPKPPPQEEPLPWGLALPAGWQEAGLRYRSDSGDQTLTARTVLLFRRTATPTAEYVLAAWHATLAGQGWQRQAQAAAPPAWGQLWAQGAARRAVVLLEDPWDERLVWFFAYHWQQEPAAPPGPQWHGELEPAQGALATRLALLFQDPQWPPALTLAVGEPPPGGPWPLTQQATMALGRHAPNGQDMALLRAGNTAAEALDALKAEGWSWDVVLSWGAGAALLGSPTPENSSPFEAPRLTGLLCRQGQGTLAFLRPDGWLALYGTPGPCPRLEVQAAVTAMKGWLSRPPGFPLESFGVQVSLYASRFAARNMFAFWLPGEPSTATAWVAQQEAAFAARGWPTRRLSPTTLLAQRPAGAPGADVLLFALPLEPAGVFFGLLVNE